MSKTYDDKPPDSSISLHESPYPIDTKVTVVTKPSRTRLWAFSNPVYKD